MGTGAFARIGWILLEVAAMPWSRRRAVMVEAHSAANGAAQVEGTGMAATGRWSRVCWAMAVVVGRSTPPAPIPNQTTGGHYINQMNNIERIKN
jgi:hypothetical protein